MHISHYRSNIGWEKELIALKGKFMKNELSWAELLTDIKCRELNKSPELAIGNGSLGFCEVFSKVYKYHKMTKTLGL